MVVGNKVAKIARTATNIASQQEKAARWLGHESSMTNEWAPGKPNINTDQDDRNEADSKGNGTKTKNKLRK